MIKTLHRWYDKLRKPLLKPASRQKPVKWRCFTIEDRKITPPMSCEVNAVDHCNIACLDCNHAAPALPESYADPGSVHRDLARLAKVYKAGCLKILGGEPLLHPDLLSLVQAARASRISQTIRLITNGTLLHRMPDTIWSSIDELELSHYPEPELKEHHLRTIEKKAREHNVRLIRYYYRSFRITFSTIGTRNENLVRRIYRTCKLARLWGCQSIYQGYFYKCPQSIYIPRLLDPALAFPNTDCGAAITDEPVFFDRLADYLSREEPLKACRFCLGSVGKQRPHRLVDKKQWHIIHRKPTEALIDFHKLQQIETGADAPDIHKQSLDADVEPIS